IVAAMMQFTIITLECFFAFKEYTLIQKDPLFKKLRAASGYSMTFSGIMLTALMYREKNA
ncbi:MAG: hypothetical protein ACK55Z_31965, partial [bacterium]